MRLELGIYSFLPPPTGRSGGPIALATVAGGLVNPEPPVAISFEQGPEAVDDLVATKGTPPSITDTHFKEVKLQAGKQFQDLAEMEISDAIAKLVLVMMGPADDIADLVWIMVLWKVAIHRTNL